MSAMYVVNFLGVVRKEAAMCPAGGIHPFRAA